MMMMTMTMTMTMMMMMIIIISSGSSSSSLTVDSGSFQRGHLSSKVLRTDLHFSCNKGWRASGPFWPPSVQVVFWQVLRVLYLSLWCKDERKTFPLHTLEWYLYWITSVLKQTSLHKRKLYEQELLGPGVGFLRVSEQARIQGNSDRFPIKGARKVHLPGRSG